MRNTKTIAALVLVALAASLTGCGNKEAEENAAREKAKQEALNQFMHQGNGKVRKWGESGFVDVSKIPNAAPTNPPSSAENTKGK